MTERNERNILWFDELNRSDVELVGGKSSSLGELTSQVKVPVPYGFATTVHAYRHFMDASGVNDQVNRLLKQLTDIEDTEQLHTIGKKLEQRLCMQQCLLIWHKNLRLLIKN